MELTKMYKREKLQGNVNMPRLLKPLSRILRCTEKQRFIQGLFKTKKNCDPEVAEPIEVHYVIPTRIVRFAAVIYR
jgi:hypothetical protein